MALIAKAFPNDVNEKVDMTPSRSEHVGARHPQILPLFLSGAVQLPSARCSMHLFEQRYRLLARRALDGGGEFAMAWAKQGSGFPLVVDTETLHGAAACIVRIEQSQQTPDGRWNLRCVGVNPAIILECWIEDGSGELYMAKLLPSDGQDLVEQIDEPDEGNQILSQEGSPQAGDATSLTRERDTTNTSSISLSSSERSAVAAAESMRHIREKMHLLGFSAQAIASASNDASQFSWDAAAALAGYGWIDNSEQQVLLEMHGPVARLKLLCGLYERALHRRFSLEYFLRPWAPLLFVGAIAWFGSYIWP